MKLALSRLQHLICADTVKGQPNSMQHVLEVTQIGLVGPHILGGDDQIKWKALKAACICLREGFPVHVGKDDQSVVL